MKSAKNFKDELLRMKYHLITYALYCKLLKMFIHLRMSFQVAINILLTQHFGDVNLLL